MNLNLRNSITKKNISLCLFLFINFLFLVKYTARISKLYLPLSILVSLFIFTIWFKQDVLLIFLKKIKISINLLLIVFLITCFFIFKYLPVATLHVDRWSVITSFWDSFFKNQYVYFAKSTQGNPPGPMPFYFILALPFYLIKELGWFSALGILLFVYAFKIFKISKEIRLLSFIIILISPFYIWEICSRSNLFLNGTLILISIIAILKYYEQTPKLNLLFGIVIGLLLSTRNVFIIPYIICFLYMIKNKKIDWICK